MRRISPMQRIWIGICLVFSLPALGQEGEPWYLRHQNPFLQIFGLPAPEGGTITAAESLDVGFVLKIANHADSGRTLNEEIRVDGESYYADLVLRYGVNERWEIGLDLPWVAHSDGVLDNLIESWHDTFGLSNRKREGVSNQLALVYQRNGVAEFEMIESAGGIGDLRLTAGYQMLAGDARGRSVALRAQLKLPTGDADRLLGSGATDLAMAVDATDVATFAGYNVDLFGQLGIMALGEGDVLTGQQEKVVSFASGGLLWHWTDTVDIQAQVAFQDPYFDNPLNELGGTTAELALGVNFYLPRLGLKVSAAFMEDLVSDAAPDFSLYFSIRR